MSTKEFKIGDRVYISDKSEFINEGYYNGKKMIGTIVNIVKNLKYSYKVIWENKIENVYQYRDIIRINSFKINIHK